MRKAQHPVRKENLEAIGDIVVSFALLEHSLQHLIGKLISQNQRIGKTITAELSFRNLRALAISLYLEKFGENQKYIELKKLMVAAGKLENERNKIIHSIWGAGKDKNHNTRIKTTAKERNGLNFQFEEMSTNKIQKLAEDIKECVHEIGTF